MTGRRGGRSRCHDKGSVGCAHRLRLSPQPSDTMFEIVLMHILLAFYVYPTNVKPTDGQFIRYSVPATMPQLNRCGGGDLQKLKWGRKGFEMSVNMMNTVVSAKRAEGHSVSQTADDLLGFSQPCKIYSEVLPNSENINIHSCILMLMVMGEVADW